MRATTRNRVALRRTIATNDAFVLDAERVLSSLNEVESSQRGFLITGDDAYLATYRAGREAVPQALGRMRHTGLPLESFLRRRPGPAERRRDRHRRPPPPRPRWRGRLCPRGPGSSGDGAVPAGRCGPRCGSGGSGTAAPPPQALIGRLVLWVIGGAALCGAFAALGLFAWRRRQESRQGAALLHAVMQNAPVGLGLLDRDLAVRSMNRSLAAIAGVEPLTSERPLWEVMPGTCARRSSPGLQAVMAGAPAVHDLAITPDSRDGAEPRAFEVSVYPLADRTGGAGIVVADVTARHRAERLVKEGEQRFRTLIDASAAIVWTTDAQGRFTRPRGSLVRLHRPGRGRRP